MINVRFFVAAFLLLSFSNASFGQDLKDTLKQETHRNSLYLELGGKSFYGVNVTYERIFLDGNNVGLSGLVGLGYTHGFVNKVNKVNNIYSVGSNLLLRKNKKLMVEIGVVGSFFVMYNSNLKTEEYIDLAEKGAIACDPPFSFFLNPNLGARFNLKNNFLLRFNYMPVYYKRIKYCTSPDFYPYWGGMSIGKLF